MPFHKVIGIDLGTTYSAVSVWDGRSTHVIDTPFGTKTVPSVVGLDPEGQVVVGKPAQENITTDPANTVIEVKREMGVYERPPRDADDTGEPRRIRFRGREYLPQEISAFILKELKRQAENFVGEPIHDAVITVPAYFKEPQRGATKDAANMARLNVRRLLNEPTAAAVSFGADKVEDERVHTYAVYDLGGGTFDVSIIQVAPGNVSVVGTGGDARLGGGDFDDRLVDYALDQIRQRHGVDLSGDSMVRQRIKREAEIRKRELSVATATTLNLPYLTPTLSANVAITRTTFESLISDLLDRSIRCLDEAIESAHESNGIERDEIEQVLLVGGSTRIARIRPMLAEHLGLEPRDIRGDISPEEVVTRGAGMVAREYAPLDSYQGPDLTAEPPEGTPAPPTGAVDVEQPNLQDVTSHTLGILANRADFIPILPRDSRIPGEATQDNFINADAYKTVDVLIFQGEERVAFDNALIGKVPIELPEPRERGYYRFAVTFSLDQSGLLQVAVRCLNDGQIWRTDLQCNVRVDPRVIERGAEHVDAVMAGHATTTGEPRTPAGGLPEPPRRGNASPAPEPPVATPADNRDRDDPPVPQPPVATPAEFRMVARRSYKLIGQLAPSERDALLAAYTAFVHAVDSESPDVEALGDELDDAFHRIHRPG